MALRRAKRGAKAGNEFWGCTNFPACRQIIHVGESA
jgi:ssDNA-binding Zn-finger/Zn-ribbon topoisomerase 1